MSDPIRLWSVTTLQGLGVPKGEALTTWAAKTTAEAAVKMHAAIGELIAADCTPEAVDLLTGARFRTKRKAADRGDAIHRIAEKIALGVPPVYNAERQPYVDQLERFLEDHRPAFKMAEAPVYNLTYQYAGTLDSIVDIDDVEDVLLDIKTTDKAPPELDPTVRSRPPYAEIALQMAAYARAEYVGLSPRVERTYFGRRYYHYDPSLEYVEMPAVTGALALVISPYDYTLTPVRIDDEIFETFLHAREIARWSVFTSRHVFGPQIAGRAHEDVIAKQRVVEDSAE